MNFEKMYEYYKKHPPSVILDDYGVRHVKEIEHPGEYEIAPCECGKTHPLDSETWYHRAMKITEDEIGVYRACKECRSVLLLNFVHREGT